MQVHGHELPESLLAAAERFARAGAKSPGQFKWPGGGWPLRRPAEFGCWRGGAIRLFLYPIPDIAGETVQVASFCFSPGGCPTTLPPEPRAILCVGDFGVDSPVCLDYGRSGDGPRVVWLDDAGVWQAIAPDFASFLTLFEDEV
jgi:hypothetical protein